MNEELLSEGLTLMMLGMGFVFLFLIFLVFMTGLMSKIIMRFPCATPNTPMATHTPSDPHQALNQDELIAVISAAVHRHRAHHHKNNDRG